MEPLKNIANNELEVAEEIKELNVSSNFAGHYLASKGSKAKSLIKKQHKYIQHIDVG